MNYLKIGNQYVNMDQVQQVAPDERLGIKGALFLHTSDHLIRITDQDEQTAVLAWLDRNSQDALGRRNDFDVLVEEARGLCEELGASEWSTQERAQEILEDLINLRWPLLRDALKPFA